MAAPRYGGGESSYRPVGEHSQRQTLSRVGIRGGVKGERGTKYSSWKAKGTKKGQVAKMFGLYREERVGEG